MEFERALFRIHQRTLYSDSVRKVRLSLEGLLPPILGALIVCLAVLHTEYVGQARCLPGALRRAGLWNATSDSAWLPDDVLLYLTLVEGDELSDLTLRMGSGPEPTDKTSAWTSPAGGVVVAAEKNATGPSWRGAQAYVDPARVIGSYRFALDREMVVMKQSVLEKHGFQVHNVSISESCLDKSRFLFYALPLFEGWDGIVINELAYSLRTRGYLERLEDGKEVETWSWSAEQVDGPSPVEGRSIMVSFFRKVAILTRAGIAFILISAVTGFFIRVAVNGSAVLMFPIAMASNSFGSSSERMSLNVLQRSFPWVGVHVEVLRRGGRPLWPLFRSHLAFLFIQSFAYLSCNLAWRFMLYRKSSPEGFEERIFSLCSVIELFNLIFVRSSASAAIYPRLMAASV
ncbi:unnamed protein product, partial [Polarella glacialis]